ncbi:phosphoribosylglycinamide synthetase C domain-containing protein [Escherichia coli]
MPASWIRRKPSHDPAAIGVVLAAGGYPGDYASNDPISGLPVDEVAGGEVFHAGTRLEGHHQPLTQGGRVLCATALGHTVQEAQQRATPWWSHPVGRHLLSQGHRLACHRARAELTRQFCQ